jgi:mRNA interferase MazF
MTKRGDVVLLDFPFTTGGSKIRPAVVIQNDRDNGRMLNTIVAMVSGNLKRAAEPTHLLVDPASAEGLSSGLHARSLVVCVNLYTVDQSAIIKVIGRLADPLVTKLNDCLKVAVELP